MDEDAHVDVDGDGQGEEQPHEEEEEEDPELEALKRKVKQMQEEHEALEKIQQAVEQSAPGAIRKAGLPAVDKSDKDARSVYVGNVDYGAQEEELKGHFAAAGAIEHCTILKDKFTGRPKGYAYLMFTKPESAEHALLLNETTFRGRLIKVTAKRTNVPAAAVGRGRGGPRGGGGYGGYGGYGYNSFPRRGGRGRGRRGYAPY